MLRRHIQVATIEHIGKEANRWEEQLYLGENPEAQIEYGVAPQDKDRLRGTVLACCQPLKPGKLAKAASMSVGYVSSILAGQCNSKAEIWLKLLKTAQTLMSKLNKLMKAYW